MATGDRHGRGDRHGKDRRTAPDRIAEQVREEEREAVGREPDATRDVAQDALGNQGVAAMLGMATVRPGSAGTVLVPADRDQEEAVDHGGDDDLPPDGPLTLDDLVRSWAPGTKRGQDAAVAPTEAGSDLPDEDAALLAAIRADPRRPVLAPAVAIDALLQLSVAAVARDPGPCAREAARWATGSLTHRAWARLLAPPAPSLQDPQGRLVHSRIRVAALTSLLVVDGPLPRDTRSVGMPSFCLELAARWSIPERVRAAVRGSENELPSAADLLRGLLAGRREGEVSPAPLDDAAAAHLRATLGELVRAPQPSALLSSAVQVVEEEADDPLGLDAIMVAFTGGAADPKAGTWDGLLQAAERLARLGAGLRVDAAGLLLAVAQVADLWSSGAPTRDLQRIAGQVDAEVSRVLRLLVEVARAIRQRAVSPPGIRNGLRRAAKAIEATYRQLPVWIGPVVGGVLPPAPGLPSPPPPPRDALEEAWADGDPLAAVGALERLPASLDRDVAIAWTRAAAGARGLADELLALAARATARPALAGALEISAGPCLLWDGERDRALALARRHAAVAAQRRNGTWLATAGLLEVEARLGAGDVTGARHALRETAWRCWHLGAPAALTLLLRWRPPEGAPST